MNQQNQSFDPPANDVAVRYVNSRTGQNQTFVVPIRTTLASFLADTIGLAVDTSNTQVLFNGARVTDLFSVLLEGTSCRVSVIPSKSDGA